MERVLTEEEKLKETFNYIPDTGEFYYKDSRPLNHFKTVRSMLRWQTMFAGKLIYNPDSSSGPTYNKLNLDGRKYKAHRVAWLFMTGSWPNGEIDHINRDGMDNRFSNLRDVPKSDNMRNASIKKNNKSGVKGVYWRKDISKWVANGCSVIDGISRKVYLGAYTSIEAASAARKRWESEEGSIFHKIRTDVEESVL